MTNLVNTSNTCLIRQRRVTEKTGLGKSTIYDLMARNLFPQRIVLAGGKAVAWLESEIDEWITQQVTKSRQ